MKDLKDTIDNGESEVQITTIGKVIGTGPDGKPVEQNLTEDALKKLAEKHKDDEILVDQDHESETTTNTEAKGWLSGIKFIPGKGLWGKIKWTDIGRKLVENRVFRWLSPSWYLNKDTKEPLQMTSVALTNKPSQAGRIEPIVNSQPIELTDNTEEIEMTMTKEELVELIKQIILDLKKEKKVEELDKAIDAENDLHEEVIDNLEQEKIDVENGVIQNSKPEEDPEKKDDTEKAEDTEQVKEATNACGDDTEKVESTNTDPEKADEAEDMKEEKKEDEEEKKEEKTESTTSELDKTDDPEEKKEEEEEEEEVIKIEALNATPKTFGLDVVKNTGIGQRKLEYPEQGYAIVTKVN